MQSLVLEQLRRQGNEQSQAGRSRHSGVVGPLEPDMFDPQGTYLPVGALSGPRSSLSALGAQDTQTIQTIQTTQAIEALQSDPNWVLYRRVPPRDAADGAGTDLLGAAGLQSARCVSMFGLDSAGLLQTGPLPRSLSISRESQGTPGEEHEGRAHSLVIHILNFYLYLLFN